MGKLSTADMEMFSRLRISPELVAAAGIERVTDGEAREQYGIVGHGDMTGIVFPYLVPDGSHRRVTCRLRRDHPEIEDRRPRRKYVAPFGDARHLYFPPGAAELLKDQRTEIVFVESEKAALALLEWSRRVGLRLLPVATGGCWGWRGRIGKTVDAAGVRVDETGPLPDLLCAERRRVYILFDVNAATNADVQKARSAFAAELRKRRAEVAILNLPSESGINGPDDFLAANTDHDMARVFERPKVEPEIKVGSAREDTSNAERFASQHKDLVRFWHGRNKWVLWKGTHWAEDVDGQVAELAKETARSIYSEAAGLPKRPSAWGGGPSAA